jgi:hypothetical protein
MNERNYFKCTVKVEYEDNKGRIKFRREEYLVNAVSPTDVETQINKEMEGTGDFEIVSIVLTKILAVLDD